MNSVLSVIFVGTGEFGVPILEKLLSDKRFKIPFIVTAPDKPAGRGLKETSSPIKKIGLLNKLIIQQPRHIQDLEQKITQEKPDFLLVVSYGEIIPNSTLNIPKFGSVNVHSSLLPKYRGASPIQEAILMGDNKAGVTWLLMDEKMDSGDIIAQEKCPIENDDNFPALYSKLSILAAKKTPDVLFEYSKNGKAAKQVESQATYCGKISKEDGEINLKKETAEEILRKIRAYTPWPGCYFFMEGKRIKIIQADTIEQKIDTGNIQILDKKILALGTLKGTLSLTRIQPESKKEMSALEYLRGLQDKNSKHEIRNSKQIQNSNV